MSNIISIRSTYHALWGTNFLLVKVVFLNFKVFTCVVQALSTINDY